MTTTPSDPATLYSVAATALQDEERSGRPTDYRAWRDALARRATLASQLEQLQQVTAELLFRLNALPILPRAEHVHWALAALELPSLAFLEIDTDGLYADADILRIALVDRTGAVLYDQLVQPRRPVSPKIARLTGLTPERVQHAPLLSEVWRSSEFAAAFVGRYLLSFNLEFDLGKLSENAARYELPSLPLIGECLMLRAQEYYGTGLYPKLADLCARLGHPLPEHPQQDALDRARGQVCLLRAMSQGITHAPVAPPVPDEAETPQSGDPFLPDFPDEDE